MDKVFVLDTSAIFAYMQEEPGSSVVEDILNSAGRRKQAVYMSFVSFTELYYVTWKAKSEQAAKELIILIKSLPVEMVHSTERIALLAARLKAKHPLSLADSLIAASAIDKEATLVHKDRELTIINQYTKTLELPFKG